MENSSLMDMLRVRQEAATPSVDEDEFNRINQAQEQRSMVTSALVGATPLLMGFLAGNKGDGYKIASEQLLKEGDRRFKEEGTLMSYLRKKNTQLKGKDGFKLRYNPELGYNEYVQESELRTGERGPETRRSKEETLAIREGINELDVKQTGKGSQFRKDPEGRDVLVNKATLEQTPIFEDVEPGISPEVKKLGDSVAKQFTSSVAKKRETSALLDQASNLLSTKSQLPNMYGMTLLLKSGEGSRMTDEDRRHLTENLSKVEALKEWLGQQKGQNPELAKRKKQEAIETIGIMKSILKRNMDSEVDLWAKSNAKKDNPIEYEYFKKRLSQGTYLAGPQTKSKSQNKSKEVEKQKIKTPVTTGFEKLSDDELEARILKLKGKE